MTSKTVAQKMRLREGAGTMLVGAPATALDRIEPPSLRMASELEGEFDYLHLFVTTATSP